MQERIPERFHLDPLRDVQVLCPINRGSLGVRELNTALQRALNPLRAGQPSVERFGWRFQMGDKIIQTENDYDKEVFNGDIGTVERIDAIEHQVVVRFDDRMVKYDFGELDEVAPAYTVTIHKSQGSEFPAVVIPLATQHYMLLQRNLIYTGITRGKKLVVLIGQKKALGIAVHNDRPQRRYSGLLASLKGDGRGTCPSACPMHPTVKSHPFYNAGLVKYLTPLKSTSRCLLRSRKPTPLVLSQPHYFFSLIDLTPCSSNHLLTAAGSNRTIEPTRNDGIAPRFARRRIVTFAMLSNFASSSAVRAPCMPRTRDARDFK